MDYITLGKNIRKERRNQNLTQESLAEQAEISAVFLSQIETANKTPSLDTVWKLAKILNVSLDSLINDNSKDSNNVHIELLLKGRTKKETQFVFKVIKEILVNIREDELL